MAMAANQDEEIDLKTIQRTLLDFRRAVEEKLDNVTSKIDQCTAESSQALALATETKTDCANLKNGMENLNSQVKRLHEMIMSCMRPLKNTMIPPWHIFFGYRSYLSNFYSSPLTIDGTCFQTAEAAFQFKRAQYYKRD